MSAAVALFAQLTPRLAVAHSPEPPLPVSRLYAASVVDDPATTKFHDDVEDLLQDPNTRLDEDFAGAWIDQADRSRVFVGFKGPDAVQHARTDPSKAKLANDRRVTFVVQRFSQQELAAASHRVMTKLNALLANPPPKESWPFATAIRSSANVVDVTIDRSASGRKEEIESALADDISAGRVRLTYDGDIHQNLFWNGCILRSPCTPMRGGLDTGGPGCTSGFVFTNPSSFQKNDGSTAPAHTRFMSTAGHCYLKGANMAAGGVTIGPVEFHATTLSGNVDVDIADITNSPDNAQPYNSIYRGPGDIVSDTRVTLKISTPYSGLEGNLLCQEGVDGEAAGLQTCGYLTSWDASLGAYDGFGQARDMWGCHGDSGAPVVAQSTNRAYGMIVGSPNSSECADHATFTWTVYAESQFGMQLLLQSGTERIKRNQSLRGEFENGDGDQRLLSPNGDYQAVMQDDGNFVLYGPGGAIWSSQTWDASQDRRIVMQSDGNLVIYKGSGGTVACAMNTPSSGNFLKMQDNGDLIVYTLGGTALWKRGPTHHPSGCSTP